MIKAVDVALIQIVNYLEMKSRRRRIILLEHFQIFSWFERAKLRQKINASSKQPGRQPVLSTEKGLQCRFYVLLFNAKMLSTSDKTAATAVSLAAAVVYSSYSLLPPGLVSWVFILEQSPTSFLFILKENRFRYGIALTD